MRTILVEDLHPYDIHLFWADVREHVKQQAVVFFNTDWFDIFNLYTVIAGISPARYIKTINKHVTDLVVEHTVPGVQVASFLSK